MSQAEAIVEEILQRRELRVKLARALAVDIASEETLRSLLLEGLLRDVATKKDLERLEVRFERGIAELREEIRRVHERLDSMFKWVIGLMVVGWSTLASLLVPVVIKLLLMH